MWFSPRWVRPTGTTWRSFSRAGAARKTAGAWSGGERRRTGRRRKAARRPCGTSSRTASRWGCWVTRGTSRWRGARWRRGRRSGISAASASRGTHFGWTKLGEDPEKVWSIVCFFVRRPYRGQGMLKRMIEAAAEHAFRRGADMVEAYPVDPDSPSYRFMGFVPCFEECGFVRVGTAGSRRHVMRLKRDGAGEGP